MEVGFIGLGKMGLNMTIRLLNGKHEVIAYDRSSDSVKSAEQNGATPTNSLEELTKKLSKPRIVWMMIPTGKPIEDTIQQLIPLLQKDDILIDGGNSFYKDSMKVSDMLKEQGIYFMDIGVSGGIWGLENGYCLMAGGEKEIFDKIEPILKTLAQENGYEYVGKSGSGHFIKMVHNGIEYGLLQAYAEGFEILNSKEETFNLDLSRISHLWNHGSVIQSWLLDLAKKVFDEDAKLSSIKAYVEDSGEGRWTVKEAIDDNISAPIITLALLERISSRIPEAFRHKFIAAMRNQFGGHAVKTK